MLRVFLDLPLSAGLALELPAEAARHVQVLRLQPGDALVLFNGQGGEWTARVVDMGRRHVSVEVLIHVAADRELPGHVCLALGMPANERFDWLIEKACELGAHAIQPLMCERSVLRVTGERAERKREHWQAVAVAAAEQSGRTHAVQVHTPLPVSKWLAGLEVPAPSTTRWMLSFSAASQLPVLPHAAAPAHITLLSGPEGGLTAGEEALALAQHFAPVTLGPRVLRAETAPLACLAWIGLQAA